MKFPIIAGLAVLIFLAVITYAQEKRRSGTKAVATPAPMGNRGAPPAEKSGAPGEPAVKKTETEREKFLAKQAAARQAEEARKREAAAATPSPASTVPQAVPPAPAASAPPASTPIVTTRQPARASAPDPPALLVDEFFRLLARGDLDLAYGTLTKGSKVMGKAEDVRVLKQKTKEAIELFGAIAGHELVETKPVGASLMRRTYLSLGSEFPLRWRFYFYNANGTWRLIDMRVDDQLVGLFDEAAEPRDPGAKLSLQP